MPKPIIAELAEEQEALLSIYRDKWKALDLSTEPIARDRVSDAIASAYLASLYPKPEIWFYDNPDQAIAETLALENFTIVLGRKINIKFFNRVMEHLIHQCKQRLEKNLFIQLRNRISCPEYPYYSTPEEPRKSAFTDGIGYCTEFQVMVDLDRPEIEFCDLRKLADALQRPADWSHFGCFLDFCISILKIGYDRKKWQALQNLMQYSGFILPFEKVCIAIERPCKLFFDENNHLHAEGEPALQFPDGYGVYACHGQPPKT